MKNSRRPEFGFLLSLLIIVGIFYILTIRPGHYWGGDFSQYLHHAKNIAEGQNYKDIGYISNPYYPEFLGPPTYPPVFPLMLAPVYKLFGLDLKLLKIELICFFLAFLLLLYFFARRRLAVFPSFLLLAILAFNPYFWQYKDYLHLDFVFLAFIYLSLFLIEIREESALSERKRLLLDIALGISIYLSAGIKGLGMILMISLLIFDFIQYKKVSCSAVRIFIVFAVLLLLQYVFIHDDFLYLANFSLNPLHWLSNLIGYLKSNMVLWENGSVDFSKIIFSLVFYLLLLFGYFSVIRKKVSISEVFLPLFLFVLIVYQYRYNQFLLAIIPLMFIYIFRAVAIISARYFIEKRKWVAGLLIALIALNYAMNYSRADFGPVREGVETEDTRTMFYYVRTHTAPTDVFAFWRPRVLTLYTDRPAATYHQSGDKALFRFFDEINLTYLISGPLSEPLFENRPADRDFLLFPDQVVARNQGRFKQVYSNKEFKIYRYLPQPSF